jgi:lysophospholipase L1-like esterase
MALLLASTLMVTGPLAAQVDLSNYVSIGDSLTAGFTSLGLVDEAQRVSYPALIHQQATGSSAGFELPLVSPPGLPALLQLRSLAPLIIAPASGSGFPTNLTLPRPYNNLGVPGADTNDVLNTITDNGGLHDLILRGIGTQLQQALASQPTFISVWIGNNDALGAVLSGLVIEDVTLTSVNNFNTRYRAIIGGLASAGVPMVVANIAAVTSVPFATTIPPILVDPSTNTPVLVNGAPVPLIGPDGPLTFGADLLTLNATSQLTSGRGIPVAFGGSGLPLTDDVVLSAAEIATISQRIIAFNNIIGAVAGEVGAALVDINGIFADVAADGIELGGVEYTTSFLTGGLFSYDGFHPSATGYAVTANNFIDAINNTFNAGIPVVDLGPFVFGPLGSAGTSVGVPVGGDKDFVFTRAADRLLREGMGMPDRKTLNRLKREQVQAGNTGSGGGGSGGGDVTGEDGSGATQRCDLPAGHGHFCDECGPCTFGEGDCDQDSDCAGDLTCANNRGADFGFAPKVDICM